MAAVQFRATNKVLLISLTTLFFLILFIPVAIAGVTRSIASWNCPEVSGASKGYVSITLSEIGAATSYAVEEILDDAWNLYFFGEYSKVDLAGPTYSVTFFRPISQPTISYKIKVNPGVVGTISGTYVLDSNPAQAVTGDTAFTVRQHSCTAGSADDLDADGCGPGCSCSCSDCDDTIALPNSALIDQNATSYSGYNAAQVYQGHAEVYCNGINDDCSGSDCCPYYYYPVDNPLYYDGTSPPNVCNDLDDSEKLAFINAWFIGTANPSLSTILSYTPSNYYNP